MTDPKARRLALEDLRQRHFADLEQIYSVQYALINDPDTKKADVNNGVKNLLTMLGVGRVGPEKPPEPPKTARAEVQEAPITDARMAEIMAKLGRK